MADTFSLEINGDTREIKMSFGLLNNLCRLVGDIDNAAMMTIDPVMRESILVELLSHRDAKGKVKEKIDLDSLDAAAGDIVDLIDWAGEHVFDFFLKGLERTRALQDKNLDRIKALTRTQTGSAV